MEISLSRLVFVNHVTLLELVCNVTMVIILILMIVNVYCVEVHYATLVTSHKFARNIKTVYVLHSNKLMPMARSVLFVIQTLFQTAIDVLSTTSAHSAMTVSLLLVKDNA